jgi:hypothetical protein
MAFITESQLREVLRKKLVGSAQAAVARDAGIGPNLMSMVVHGAPITGKLLAFLGYSKVREKLYQKRVK